MNLTLTKKSCSAKLERLFEYWLRQLRDLHGTDHYQYFSVDQTKLAITFNANLPPEEGQRFVDCVNWLIVRLWHFGLRVEVQTRHGPGQNGCSFELRFLNLRWWSCPKVLLEQSAIKKLYGFGNNLAQQLYSNTVSPACEDPFTYRVVPAVEFPGVWVYLRPTEEIYDYPRVDENLIEDIAIVQDQLKDPSFRVARFVQTGNEAAILFDLKGD